MSYGSSSPEQTIVRGTAIAAVISTVLAMPIMLFWVLVLSLADKPSLLEGQSVAKLLLILPLALSFSAAGVGMWPFSLVAGALLTFLAAMKLPRAEADGDLKQLAHWVASGALIGLVIAAGMLLENDMARKLVGSQPRLLLAGALTGMAAMAICRRLTRQLAG